MVFGDCRRPVLAFAVFNHPPRDKVSKALGRAPGGAFGCRVCALSNRDKGVHGLVTGGRERHFIYTTDRRHTPAASASIANDECLCPALRHADTEPG